MGAQQEETDFRALLQDLFALKDLHRQAMKAAVEVRQMQTRATARGAVGFAIQQQAQAMGRL